MIQPQSPTLSKLLNENLFIIPDYQRSYSWQTKQRNALFEDIIYLHQQRQKDKNASHFMSTIVCLQKEPLQIGSTEYVQYDVVDGQQRLTTLIILLKTIELRLEGKEKKDLHDILVKADSSTTPILLMNHDENRIYKDFIVRGKIAQHKKQEELSDKLLIDAINECNDFLDKWIKIDTIENLYSLLKNDLYFILHAMDNE